MSFNAEHVVPARRRRRTRRNILLMVLALFLAAALASAVFVANLARSYQTQTKTIPEAEAFPNETLRPAKPTEGPAAAAVNILLLGSDSRGDSLNLAEEGDPSNQRSDTIMWLHVPADRRQLFLMSVMRDTWVDIPGFGEAKINAAMAYGGVPLVVQTLEGLFKNRIDHVAIVDFEGFKSITDALGGVEVNVPVAFTSRHGNFTFNAGKQKLTGDQALGFVRERYAFADGDYQRVKDQQIFLRAVLNSVLQPAVLANPVKVSELVAKVSPYLSVDAGLDWATVGSLAVSLNGLRAGNVHTFTLPTLGTWTSQDGQSIVIRDDAAISGIGQAMGADAMASYLEKAGLG